MPEISPNLNREASRPPSPEEVAAAAALEKREKEIQGAREMLDAMVEGKAGEPGVRFEKPYADDALAQETAKILPFKKKEEVIETETGLPPQEAEKLRQNPIAWVQEAIGNQNLAANDKMKGLIEAMEEEEKRKAA
jgi:hypothetical protein